MHCGKKMYSEQNMTTNQEALFQFQRKVNWDIFCFRGYVVYTSKVLLSHTHAHIKFPAFICFLILQLYAYLHALQIMP